MKANVNGSKKMMEEWMDKELKYANDEIKYLKQDIKEKNEDYEAFIKWSNLNLKNAFLIYKQLLKIKASHPLLNMDYIINTIREISLRNPLSPIKEDQDVWEKLNYKIHDPSIKEEYQCTRFSPLFKKVHKDGSISYHDNERVVCKDYILESCYTFGLGNRICDELFPIKLPYKPGDELYTFYMYQFLSDPSKDADFDTSVMLYIEYTDETGKDKVKTVNRYFREPEKDESPTYGGWVEIGLEELEQRIASSKSNLTLEDLDIYPIRDTEKVKEDVKSENLNQFLSDAT